MKIVITPEEYDDFTIELADVPSLNSEIIKVLEEVYSEIVDNPCYRNTSAPIILDKIRELKKEDKL